MSAAEEALRCAARFFPGFGVNKKNQTARLIYETAKREETRCGDIAAAAAAESKSFAEVKEYLLRRRYPETPYGFVKKNVYLPFLSADPAKAADLSSPEFYPRQLIYEKDALGTPVLSRALESFPDAEVQEINSFKDYMAVFSGKAGYNSRRSRLFLIMEKHDFFKKCPCTSGCVNCSYRILNTGFGCPYECTYCFLQEYSNIPGIVIPCNTGDFLSAIPAEKIRAGTGEFCDSLVLDRITGEAELIGNYVKENLSQVLFEFKTKSCEIEGLLRVAPAENVVAAWSVNPEKAVEENEHFTRPLEKRLEAAAECVRAGLPAAFHFDPVIRYPGWEQDYCETVDRIFDSVERKAVRWISLGTLRFSRNLKRVIEERFPDNRLLDGELFRGFDGKMRYCDSARVEVYRKIISRIRKNSPGTLIYLCMESRGVWERSGLDFPPVFRRIHG